MRWTVCKILFTQSETMTPSIFIFLPLTGMCITANGDIALHSERYLDLIYSRMTGDVVRRYRRSYAQIESNHFSTEGL